MPNYLIVGANKCGTTLLRSYLQQHEEVYIAPRALHFFDRDDRYAQGIEWYRSQLQPGNQCRACGEKTPRYCFAPQAPERIRRHLPWVKLIWIFRDPVARAYSHYWQRLRRGMERDCFEAAVERGLKTQYDGAASCEILARGRYAEQVRKYLEFFPREQMHFFVFEDFVRDPKPALRTLFDFIGVTPDVDIDAQSSPNKGYVPRSVPLVWYSRKLFDNTVPHKLITKLNRGPRRGYPSMPSGTRELLLEYYRPHNRELAEILGWDLSAWETDGDGTRPSPRTCSQNRALETETRHLAAV